jgi:type VI secretion system protein ImpK
MTEFARQQAALPLKQAFCQVWEEWLLLSPSLLSSAEPTEKLLLRVAEETSVLARRAYRLVMTQAGAANKVHAQAVQYAFVALIDEVLLFTEWSGQVAWQTTPLEFRLFNTRTSGETLPDEMEHLIERQDSSERDLAAVYLMTLVLGFRGRLRREPAQFDAWCTSLFAQVYQREPSVALLGKVLGGHSVTQPLQLAERKMLPDGYRLALMLAFLLLLMFGVSHLFWRDVYLQIDITHPPLSEAKP